MNKRTQITIALHWLINKSITIVACFCLALVFWLGLHLLYDLMALLKPVMVYTSYKRLVQFLGAGTAIILILSITSVFIPNNESNNQQ